MREVEFLSVERYVKERVKSNPIPSIEFLVQDKQRRFLLGMRTNEPSKGLYFVPGGAVLKNESTGEAIRRISESEIGLRLRLGDVKLAFLHEHFWETNVLGGGLGTHYKPEVYLYNLHQGEG